MKLHIILFILCFASISFAQENGPRHAPGVFPIRNSTGIPGYDFDGVPKYGKYPGDRPDIGAYEYVPPELKDENGKYIVGSYIREDGTVYIPNSDKPRPPVSPMILAQLKKKG